MKFRVAGIEEKLSKQVRETMISPQYGHPAFVDTAKGYGPCRSCLKTFETGKEARLLFTYNAFEGLSDLPLPSPIYIHNDKCERFDACEFPQTLRELPMLFEGYGKRSELVARKDVDEQSIEQTIAALLEDRNVKYINVRNAEAGCFIARISRA